jgi:hypothetical protein
MTRKGSVTFSTWNFRNLRRELTYFCDFFPLGYQSAFTKSVRNAIPVRFEVLRVPRTEKIFSLQHESHRPASRNETLVEPGRNEAILFPERNTDEHIS